MKKITFLMMLVVSLGFSQVTIGTGNDGGTFESPPVNAYYGFSYGQSIYLSSEINATGDITSIDFQLIAGADMSSADETVDVWIGHTTKSAFDSTSDWVDVTTLTQVLVSGTVTIAADVLTITFSAPFTYNGTDNLLVAVDANEAGFGGTGDRVSATDGPTANLSLMHRSDNNNNDPLAPAFTGGRLQSRGNITLNGITAVCTSAAATASIVEDCGNSQFSILVDVTDLGDSVNLEITNDAGVASATVTAIGEVTVGPFSIGTPVVLTLENENDDICDVVLDSILDFCPTASTTLDYYNLQFPATLTFPENEMTDQFVYAQAYEAGLTDTTMGSAAAGIEAWIGYSSDDTDPSGTGWIWEVAAFNLEVGNNDEYSVDMQDLGLAEGTYYYASRFTLNAGPSMYGGILADGSNGGVWDGITNISGVLTVTARVPLAGDDCTNPINVMALPYNTSDDTANYFDDYSGSPGATSCGTTSNYLNGDDVVYAYDPIADGTIKLAMSNIGSTYSGIFVYTDCANIGTECVAGYGNGSSSADYDLELAVMAGTTYYIVISTWATPQSTTYTLDITEVLCADPSDLLMTNITTTSADFSWTENGTATSWDIEVVDITAAATVTGTPTTAATTDNPFSISGLVEQNNYEVYVRAICGSETGAWVGPIAFSSPCNATSVPFTEDFESGAACGIITNEGAGNSWVVFEGTSYQFTANHLRYSWNSANPADTWFFTQGVTLVAGQNYDLGYEYGATDTSFPENLMVAYGTSPDAVSMTTMLADHPDIVGDEVNVGAETFTAPADGVYYIGFQAYSIADQFLLHLDNITLREECLADAGTLTADATPVVLAGGTATISATANGDSVVPTDYDVTYVLTSGSTLIIEDAGATPSFEVTTAGDYTIHTLVAETTDAADPNYLDLSVIVFGTTTGGDVLDIINDNNLCAALDVAGAPIVVDEALNIDDLDKAAFTYFPNPVKNTLTLNAQNTIENVTMYNMLGQVVLKVTPNAISSDLDMSNLQTGTYFVQVMIANVTKTIRVIKQ
jgi:hypothetical protein